jgi:hypothetical protein
MAGMKAPHDVQPGHLFGCARRDARALVEHLRNDRRFRELAREVRCKLASAAHRSGPLLNYGPQQMLDHASDRARASRLIGHVERIANALPASIRPIMWTLILNPLIEPKIASGRRLSEVQFDEFIALTEQTLYMDYSWRGLLDNTTRTRRSRYRQRLDPGRAALLPAASWSGGAPTVGMPVSVNATAMMREGVVHATPNQAFWPVHSTVASVMDSGCVILEPLPFPKRFAFSNTTPL